MINSVPMGEIGLAAFNAGAYDVPIVFLSGDEAACREAEGLMPGIITVAVKGGLSRFSAVSIPPLRARKLIEKGVKDALKLEGIKPFKMKPPYAYQEYVFRAIKKETLLSNPEALPESYELLRELHADAAQDLVRKVWGRKV